MSPFTRSPTELPEIIFVDISLGRYIIPPCGNCSEIKGCLCLLTLQIPSLRRASALEAPCASASPCYQGVFAGFGKKVPLPIALSPLPLLGRWAGGTPLLEQGLPAACSPSHRLPDTDQTLLTSVAHCKLVLPQTCPWATQEWETVRHPEFHPNTTPTPTPLFFSFQYVKLCPR